MAEFRTGKYKFDKKFDPKKVDSGATDDTRAYHGNTAKIADGWVGKGVVRRPICPYGCGEEGVLHEIIQTEEGAVGVYHDSEGLVFTSSLATKPKPNSRKLVVGPDGELTIASGDS